MSIRSKPPVTRENLICEALDSSATKIPVLSNIVALFLLSIIFNICLMILQTEQLTILFLLLKQLSHYDYSLLDILDNINVSHN